jgi:hypothetical protein
VIGTLDALRRYPVKSLRGEALEMAEIEATGIPGDRAEVLVARDGARAGKAYRGKENDRLHLVDDAQAARALANARGVDVEIRGGDHFFDDAAISLLVDTWLEALNAHVGYAVQWERFRPNFFARSHAGSLPPEEKLVGRQLLLGTARLRVRTPIERCVTITYHPAGEPSDPRVLQFLAQQRNAWMGIYCDVVEPGVARRGDALALL